jgi:hypothetical protein
MSVDEVAALTSSPVAAVGPFSWLTGADHGLLRPGPLGEAGYEPHLSRPRAPRGSSAVLLIMVLSWYFDRLIARTRISVATARRHKVGKK